jgi:CTD small phosphatase-like protein 2
LNFLRRKNFKVSKDISILDKNNCFISKKGFIIKDLSIISNRKLQNIVILDNLAYSYSLQLNNGIPIVEWQSDKNDCELLGVLKYLKKLSKCEDVRKYNAKHLKLGELGMLKIEDLGL